MTTTFGHACHLAVRDPTVDGKRWLDGRYTKETGRELFAATSELMHLIGWMARDEGNKARGRSTTAQLPARRHRPARARGPDHRRAHGQAPSTRTPEPAVMRVDTGDPLAAYNKRHHGGRQQLIEEMLAGCSVDERRQLAVGVRKLAGTVRTFTEHTTVRQGQ